MSDAQDWNTVGKHRKENVGQMANGGTRDFRKDKAAAVAGQRRASKQENRSSRPPPTVSTHKPPVSFASHLSSARRREVLCPSRSVL
jgi:hypothetical protein